jgi:hypothetical protein
MKKFVQQTFPLIVLLSFTLGCSFFNQIKKQIDESQKPKTVSSTDNKSQLTVPGNWSIEKDLNQEATLQVANRFAEQYAIVISESKQDFPAKFDLDSFADIIMKNAKQTITSPIVSEIKTITINGYPAKQFEIEGTLDNIKAKWLYTMVDAPKNYHQILNWTLVSRYEQNKPVFLELINSFREIEAGAPPPPAANIKTNKR